MIHSADIAAEMPEDQGAGTALAGSLLLYSQTVDVTRQVFSRERIAISELSDPRHRIIFDAVFYLNEQREPADVKTVMTYLESAGQLADAGGAEYLGELLDLAPAAGNAEQLAQHVAAAIQRRRGSQTPLQTVGLTGPDVAWPQVDPALWHGLAGDIVHAIEPHTEADSLALLVQFLVAFGSCSGRHAYFRAEADKHYGNLDAVLVGVSSKGRKGTSWGYIRGLFEMADSCWTLERIASGMSSGEGLIWQVRNPIEKQVKDKKTGEMRTETEDPGVADKRLLALEAEFAGVLKVLAREGNTLSAIIRNAWDSGALQSLTKNSPARATGAHISIIGHITGDELRRYLDSTEAGNGFANRFLWVCVRRSKELPEGGNIAEANLSPLIFRLRHVLEFARTAGELRRDEEARTLWIDGYHDLSAGKPGLVGAVTGRAEAQVMRVALLYALLDGDSFIRLPHLQAALALWDYVEASARVIFGDSLGDPVADDILRALRVRPGGQTRNDLRVLFSGHQTSARIGQALETLQAQSLARVEKQATDGRPTERWFATGKASSKT